MPVKNCSSIDHIDFQLMKLTSLVGKSSPTLFSDEKSRFGTSPKSGRDSNRIIDRSYIKILLGRTGTDVYLCCPFCEFSTPGPCPTLTNNFSNLGVDVVLHSFISCFSSLPYELPCGSRKINFKNMPPSKIFHPYLKSHQAYRKSVSEDE